MKTIQTNTKPIDSQPMQVDIKRLANMGLLPLKKAKCSTCNGEGKMIVPIQDRKNLDKVFIDCKNCNGTGTL
jgi:DnaJ-class molecular chaperone